MDIIKLEIVNKSNIVELEMVEKFNPYHDKLGRFTTADGATVFTWRTKDSSKQGLANRAIEREKERTKAMQPKEKTVKDPDAIAGVKRGEPMSHYRANSGNVNPGFDDEYPVREYLTNCQSCVVTYEARLRGYDVITLPNTPEHPKLKELAKATHRAWLDPKTGEEIEQPPRLEGVTTPKALKKRIIDTVQPGERYNLQFRWKDRRSGHIVTIEKHEGGEVYLYDPQIGMNIGLNYLEPYFKKFQYYRVNIDGSRENLAPRLYRVDNLVINPKFADGIMETADNGW